MLRGSFRARHHVIYMHGKHVTVDSGLQQPPVCLMRNRLTCLEPPSVPQASCTMPPAPPRASCASRAHLAPDVESLQRAHTTPCQTAACCQAPSAPRVHPRAVPPGHYRHPNHTSDAPDGGDARGAAPAPASPPQARPTALPGPPPGRPPRQGPDRRLATTRPPPPARPPRRRRPARRPRRRYRRCRRRCRACRGAER